MIPDIFTNLGVGIASLVILYVVVRYFMQTLDKKDDYLKGLIKEFQDHVELCNTNFVKFGDHFSKISGKQTKAIDTLVKQMETLVIKKTTIETMKVNNLEK